MKLSIFFEFSGKLTQNFDKFYIKLVQLFVKNLKNFQNLCKIFLKMTYFFFEISEII